MRDGRERKKMLTFDEAHHKYYDGDIELPSVTTITRFCSYDSINGRGSDPFYRERGTKIHELCADYDFTDELPQGTGVDGYLKAYADFKRDYRIKDWLYVEYMIGSAKLGFAGTIDRVGVLDGKLIMPDIKTSSKLNKVALTAQLTGYLLAWNELAPINLFDPELYAIQLAKNGTYRFVKVEPDYELFEACQILHKKGLKK